MTLLSTLRPVSNQTGSTLVDENCDSTTIGNIPTGWTVESGTSWQVITAPAGLSGRALEATGDASFDHYLVKTFTRQTSGIVSIGWRVLTNSVLTGRSGVMTLYDSSGGYVAQFGPLNGVWVYGNTSGVSGSVGSWTASTVYAVTVHVDMDQKKFKMQVGTLYYDNSSAWYPLTTGTTGIDRIKFSLYSPAGGTFYIDDVQVGTRVPAASPPTTTGTLSTAGTFDSYTLGCDRFGRIVLGYANADSNAASIRLERSNDNTNWTDLGGAQQQTINTGSGRWVVIDRRPHYGTESATYGGTVYYRVSAFNSGGATPTSASGAMTADVNISAYETARFATLSSIMGGAAVPSSDTGEAYPTYWLGAMTYAYVKTGSSTYLTDVQNQWNYIKTLDAGAHGCVQLPDYTDWIYRDHHWRTVLWTAACARLLRLMGQTSLANDMISTCDAWVAAFAALNSGTPRASTTLNGFDANDDSVSNNQRVWTASTSYAVGDIVTPTARNARTYRVTVAGTSSGTQPTWPTTNGGSVSLNGVTYVETTLTGAVTYSVYSTTAPYNGLAGEALVDMNQNGEEAAALALLTADTSSALNSAGAARTAALTVITDVTNLLSTCATSTGAVPIGHTYPAINGSEGYDTLYGAYTLEVGALTHKYAPSQCHAQFDEMLVKGLNWLATSYGTEPVGQMHYSGLTSTYASELLMREYPYRKMSVTNPVVKLRYTAATNDPSTDRPTQFYDANGAATPVVDGQAARSFTSDQFLQLLVNFGTIGQVVETDLAQPVTKRKRKTVGQPSETDLSQTIAKRIKRKTVGQPVETDVSQPDTKRKTKAIRQAGERSSGSTAEPQIAIPMYIYPSFLGSQWNDITTDARGISLIVMNDASGHAGSINADYTTAVNAARAAGHTIIAYIETSYGAEPAATVKQEMANFRDWYNVDGFFLDEVSSLSGDLAYYQGLRDWVDQNMAANKRILALNHGTSPVEGYAAIGDILVTFEGTGTSYASASFNAWEAGYPEHRFWHLIYDTSFSTTYALAVSRRAGHIYITDSTFAANPWDELPSYWTTEQGSIDRFEAVKTKLIGQSSETDLAQVVTRLAATTIGQAQETDVAQAIAGKAKRKAVGQSFETDLAQTLTRVRVYHIGQTVETDAVFSLTKRRSYTLAQATETNTSQRFGGGILLAIGQATETDLAQPVGKIDHIRGLIGQAQETDSATKLFARVEDHNVPSTPSIPFHPTLGPI